MSKLLGNQVDEIRPVLWGGAPFIVMGYFNAGNGQIGRRAARMHLRAPHSRFSSSMIPEALERVNLTVQRAGALVVLHEFSWQDQERMARVGAYVLDHSLGSPIDVEAPGCERPNTNGVMLLRAEGESSRLLPSATLPATRGERRLQPIRQVMPVPGVPGSHGTVYIAMRGFEERIPIDKLY